MLAAALGNDNKLFRMGFRQDFVKVLLQDLEQDPPLEGGTELRRQVEETMHILAAIDNWENQVLDKLLMIQRCISRKQRSDESVRNLLYEIEELKAQVSIKSEKKASDRPQKSTTSKTGELSNSSEKELKAKNSPIANIKPGEKASDSPLKLLSGVGESSNDGNLTDCLNSLVVFPKNTELKKKLLLHWWIGLGLVPYGDESETEQHSGEIFSTLVKNEILIPSLVRKHYKVEDSYTINPTNYNQPILAFEENKDISRSRETRKFRVYAKDNVELAMLNVDQKQIDSKCISKSSTLKVVQLGKWHHTDQELEVNDEINEIFYDSTELSDNIIEVSGTAFLENMGQAVTYLSLKGISKIEKLPQSVGKIRGLKILDLKDCHNLQKLPQKPEPKIWEALCKEEYYWFKELRHLDISGCYLLDRMPKWVCELSNLQVLKGAVFNWFIPDQCQLQDLSKLVKLIKLSIKIIQPRSLSPEDHFTGLKDLCALRVLTIVWSIREIVETEKQSRDSVNEEQSAPRENQNRENAPRKNQTTSVNEDQSAPRENQSRENASRKNQTTSVNEDRSAPREKQSRESALDCLNIFRSRGKRTTGVNQDKMVEGEEQGKDNIVPESCWIPGGKKSHKKSQEEHKYRQKISNISFPKSLEKLDIRCYPNADAQELLDPAKLKNLKRLYIRGGKLAKFEGAAGWQVETLRLRFLKNLYFNWYELGGIFTKLQFVEYEGCPRLLFFPKYKSYWIKKFDGPLPGPQGETSNMSN
jgi:hypothetical protein